MSALGWSMPGWEEYLWMGGLGALWVLVHLLTRWVVSAPGEWGSPKK